MIEKIKQTRDNNNIFAAVLTDLSKAFDCISHEFLNAKLNAHGFDNPSLKLVTVHLIFRKQKTKVGSTFSDHLNILFGVPQAGPISSMFTLAIRFSKLILLQAMQMIIPLLLPSRTTKN